MERWIIPCNLDYYDVIGAFKELKKIEWKQSIKSINVGDEVYIYIGKPISAVKYRCRINKTNIEYATIDDSKYIIDKHALADRKMFMELELLEEFDDNIYSLTVLRKNGLEGNIQGPRRENGLISRSIDKNDVLCLASGSTYDLILQTEITAHPAIAPYPRKLAEYIIPIKKGGILEFLYQVERMIECYPDDIQFYREKFSSDEYERLRKYHETRKQTFGYGKQNQKYRFYIMDNPQAIKQPCEKKGIQISVRVNLADVHLEQSSFVDDLDKEINLLNIQGKEKLAYVKVRVNQSVFRERLLQRYKTCCLCDVENAEILRASHIKPWFESSPSEKLDVENGLILCPGHDALFDKGFISFADDGKIMISDSLNLVDRVYMNVNPNMKIELTEKNKLYMEFHRNHIFRKI